MGELLPADSLLRLTLNRKRSKRPVNTVATGRSIWCRRMMYSHICCFAYQVGSTLTLLSYQPTGTHEWRTRRRPRMRKSSARGRVWRLPRADAPSVRCPHLRGIRARPDSRSGVPLFKVSGQSSCASPEAGRRERSGGELSSSATNSKTSDRSCARVGGIAVPEHPLPARS